MEIWTWKCPWVWKGMDVYFGFDMDMDRNGYAKRYGNGQYGNLFFNACKRFISVAFGTS